MELLTLLFMPITHKADEAGQIISDFPAIEAWLARVRVQPGHVTMEVV